MISDEAWQRDCDHQNRVRRLISGPSKYQSLQTSAGLFQGPFADCSGLGPYWYDIPSAHTGEESFVATGWKPNPNDTRPTDPDRVLVHTPHAVSRLAVASLLSQTKQQQQKQQQKQQQHHPLPPADAEYDPDETEVTVIEDEADGFFRFDIAFAPPSPSKDTEPIPVPTTLDEDRSSDASLSHNQQVFGYTKPVRDARGAISHVEIQDDEGRTFCMPTVADQELKRLTMLIEGNIGSKWLQRMMPVKKYLEQIILREGADPPRRAPSSMLVPVASPGPTATATRASSFVSLMPPRQPLLACNLDATNGAFDDYTHCVVTGYWKSMVEVIPNGEEEEEEATEAETEGEQEQQKNTVCSSVNTLFRKPDKPATHVRNMKRRGDKQSLNHQRSQKQQQQAAAVAATSKKKKRQKSSIKKRTHRTLTAEARKKAYLHRMASHYDIGSVNRDIDWMPAEVGGSHGGTAVNINDPRQDAFLYRDRSAKDWIRSEAIPTVAGHQQRQRMLERQKKTEARYAFKDQKPFYGKPQHPIRKLNPYINEDTGVVRKDTPAVLILDHFVTELGQQRASELLPEWLLCSFDSQVQGREEEVELYRGVTHRRYVWYPLRLDSTSDLGDYRIYCTLVNRIDALECLMRRPGMPVRIRRQVAIWQDTHQMLRLLMEKTRRYRDSDIRKVADFEILAGMRDTSLAQHIRAAQDLKDTIKPSDFLSYYDIFKPSLLFVMHQGELPDLYKVLSAMPVWSKAATKNTGMADIDMTVMVKLLRKTLRKPQQSRELYQMFSRNMMSYPRISDCIIRMFCVSIMGLYEDIGSDVVASWHVRGILYDELFLKATSPDDMASFMFGFECEDFRKKTAVIAAELAAKARNVQEGAPKKKRAKKKTKEAAGDGDILRGTPAVVVTDWGREDAIMAMDTSALFTVKPNLLVGGNKAKGQKGYCNLTYFCQYIVNEYFTLLMKITPGFDLTMRRFYWYQETYDDMVTTMDMVRVLFNSPFQHATTSEIPDDLERRRWQQELARVSEARGLDRCIAPLAGRRFLAAMAKKLIPYMNWSSVDLAAEYLHDTTSDAFQEVTGPSGYAGHVVFSEHMRTLVETFIFCTRKAQIHYWSLYIKCPVLETIVHDLTHVEILAHKKHQTAAEGYPLFVTMLEEERTMPPADSDKILAVVRYALDDVKIDLSYEWLCAAFDLHFWPVLFLRMAESYYEKELFKKTIFNVLDYIFTSYPHEFQYLKTFFRILQREKSVQLYDLPHDVALRQIKAMHESNSLVRRGEMPPIDACAVYYCGAHMHIKHPLADEHPHFSHHYGLTNVTYDCDNDELVCKYERPSSGSRTDRPTRLRGVMRTENTDYMRISQMVSGLEGGNQSRDPTSVKGMWSMMGSDEEGDDDDDDDGLDHDEAMAGVEGAEGEGTPDASGSGEGANKKDTARKKDKAQIRRVFTNHEALLAQKDCARMPLQKVPNIIGKVLRLRDTYYFACPYCFTMTYMGANKAHTRLGLACPSCINLVKSSVSTDIEDYVRFRCAQCSTRILYRACQVRPYWLLDDTDGERPPYWRWVYFCKKQHVKYYIGTCAATLSLSIVQQYLALSICPKTLRDPVTGHRERVFIADKSVRLYVRRIVVNAEKMRRKRNEQLQANADAARRSL